MIKLWIDDLRVAPRDYIWCKSVNEAISFIDANRDSIDLIDIDHDAGSYASDGGDYIRVLDWLEFMGLNYPIRIHTQNSVGRQNMRLIIEKNGWKELY